MTYKTFMVLMLRLLLASLRVDYPDNSWLQVNLKVMACLMKVDNRICHSVQHKILSKEFKVQQQPRAE
jgi:hypothetical protein